MTKFLLLLLIAGCAHQPPVVTKKYNRKHWKHWSDYDRDCQTTRQEILIERSLTAVSTDRKGCIVMKGRWADYYYPEVHTIARAVDIDHLVPLKNAHDTGGALWDKKLKEKFANDPENLVITNLRYNRKKGSKGIDKWLPVHQNYACKYIKDWIRIKEKYRLFLSQEERKTIASANCP